MDPRDAREAEFYGPEIPVPPGGGTDCGCKVPLHRSVLDARLNATMYGCLHCGRTIGYLSRIDEPHPHIVEVVGIIPLRMETSTGRWLASWPLLAGICGKPARRDSVWLPAGARAADSAGLERLEAEAASAQHELPIVERLRCAGVPAAGPPGSLPDQFDNWGHVYRAMTYSAATPLAELLEAALSPAVLAGWIATDALAVHANLARELSAIVAGGNRIERRRATLYLAHAPLPLPAIGDLVVLQARHIGLAVEQLSRAAAASVPNDVYTDISCLKEAATRALEAGEPARMALNTLDEAIARFPRCDTARYCREALAALLASSRPAQA